MNLWFIAAHWSLTALAWRAASTQADRRATEWLRSRQLATDGDRPLKEVVRALILRKTGVLTEGKPVVTDYVHQSRTLGVETVLAVASALERDVHHPLSQAISRYVEGKTSELPHILNREFEPGEGISGELDGKPVAIGSREYVVGKFGVDRTHLLRVIGDHPYATRVYLAIAGKIAGIFYIEDTIRPEATEEISRLRHLGIEPVLVTGDNEQAAARVATAAGINRVHHSLSPAAKQDVIKSVWDEWTFVKMLAGPVDEQNLLNPARGPALQTAGNSSTGLDRLTGSLEGARYAGRIKTVSFAIVSVLSLLAAAGVSFGAIGQIPALLMVASSFLWVHLVSRQIDSFLPAKGHNAPAWVPSRKAQLPSNEARFILKGITGKEEEIKLMSALRIIDGFEQAQYDAGKKWLFVRFDPLRTSRTRLLEAVRAAGYTDMEPDYLQLANQGPTGDRWKE